MRLTSYECSGRVDVKKNDQEEIVEPKASNVVEALRDIGYSLESAVADIIDNSISAAARHIDLRFGWSPDGLPWIVLLDDGEGMSEKTLVEAMRPGGRDPLAERPRDDLGRFGLGLKTASFSQCRLLTVVTRREGVQSARQWDLDLVRRRDAWVLRTPDAAELNTAPCLGDLCARGTIVVWERLDRLDLGTNPHRVRQVLNDRIMSVREHVSLVFHRFISGDPWTKSIEISINGNPVEPFNPFCPEHAATIHLAEEPLELDGQVVLLKPYILPHHSKISAEEYERLGGSEGYLRAQGFYIYRNRRLIIHGTWFRMSRQDEMTKLARVQVDIPNSLDHLWTIDVRKSRAQPPEAVKRRLRGILDRIRETAKRPYVHRGTAVLQAIEIPIWIRLHGNERISYRPNPAHPLIAALRTDISSEVRRRFDAILALIGMALPTAMIFNDMASSPTEIDGAVGRDEALRELAGMLFGDSFEMGPEEIADLMHSTEPFASAPEFTAKYLESLKS